MLAQLRKRGNLGIEIGVIEQGVQHPLVRRGKGALRDGPYLLQHIQLVGDLLVLAEREAAELKVLGDA